MQFKLKILLVAMMFVSTTCIHAQTLTGTITDENGDPVEFARVTLFNNDTTQFWEARTDIQGRYWISDLPDGGPYLFFGVSAPGKEYFQNATTGILDTLVWDAVLMPETHPGEWEVIMESPEPLGGTDLGVLLPDGNLYYCHNTKDPFFFLPEKNDTTWAPGHVQNQGCVAPALLDDGRVLFAGGTLQKIYGPGTNKVKTFDPETGLWEYQPELLDYRWYPTLAPLYDGKLLIIGGGGLDNPKRVKTSEVYDPMNGISEAADTIFLGNEVSPVIPLYHGKVLMTHRPPQLFDPVTMQWELAADFVQGNRLPNGDHSDHELLLLSDGMVLAVGYKSFIVGEPGVNIEVYDPDKDEWTLRSNFAPTRSRAKAVQTPDQRVIIMGGQKEDPLDPTPVNNWGYMDLTDQYDPASDSWRRLQNMNIKREYHAITALVPDGRIIAVGGEGAPGNEPPLSVIEAFSPPYLFSGIRPEIFNLNKKDFHRGESIEFDIAKTNMLTSVVLISNPVLTHFMNSGNNRCLELDFIQTGNHVSASLPYDSLRLMNGWYMLFAMVDDIPSEAQIVRIERGRTSARTEIEKMPFAVTVFPNPNRGRFQVQIQPFSNERVYQLELLNIAGQLVWESQIQNASAQTVHHAVQTADLLDGLYILKVTGSRSSLYKTIAIH